MQLGFIYFTVKEMEAKRCQCPMYLVKPYLPGSQLLVVSTLPCFSVGFHSFLLQHSSVDIIIVILKIKKESQGDDFMKVTQEAFHTFIGFPTKKIDLWEIQWRTQVKLNVIKIMQEWVKSSLITKC